MNKIITFPHFGLRDISRPVVKIDRHLDKLLTGLKQTLTSETTGVGLAAPQIDIYQRAFATNLPLETGSLYQYYLNPVILDKSKELTLTSISNKEDLEGCLSVPHIYAPVWRSTWIDLKFFQIVDGQLSPLQKRFNGYASRVIQHELDHLDGILFIDRVLEQNTTIYLENKKGKLDPINKDELFKIFGRF